MLIFKKISFNNWLFTVLALQYALMHLFKLHIPNSVKLSEIIIFIVYTVSEIILFIYRGRRAAVGAVSGMIPLFFAVLWTVAFFSHFQSEIYVAELTVINSVGMFTAFFILLFEYIFLIRD
ncbi:MULTISPECIES: hypothetical protein [Paenibacillus]|uniref:Uncharacterized protein n=1 Tax=Paenibacillus borealis TaxID=160799 RepID=A0ABX3H5M9_PAEBO|nr:hypothetical protein [Paenibacillus borealis]OMD45348.1 hypothetical protein BSK56_19700 [Paenibacillus borealis]